MPTPSTIKRLHQGSAWALGIWVCTTLVGIQSSAHAQDTSSSFVAAPSETKTTKATRSDTERGDQAQQAKDVQHKVHTQAKTRFVHTPKASVRCGPGKQFYATEVLDKGASVEVFLETSDGWSGIRPPEGSHDWIPSESVYLLPGGKTAEISVERVPAWIGSSASDIESLLYQTELIKSQTVAIQGEAQREHDGKSTLWFRIDPPQGEFRWIRTSQLGDNPIATQASSVKLANENRPQSAGTSILTPSDSNVQKASATQIIASSASGDEPPHDSVVWSDEAEQIARIEHEIQQEQAAIEQQMQGKPSGSKPTKKVPGQKVSAHDQDQKYWNALQSPTDGGMKVGPMNGVLGWLGVSVVEESGPQQTRAAAQSTPYGAMAASDRLPGNSGLLASRLDRLPRPNRRQGDGSLWSVLKSQGPLFGEDPATQLADAVPPESAGVNNRAFNSVSAPVDVPNIATASYRRPSPISTDDPLTAPERFQTQAIQDAFVQLSAMVARPTEQWNLEPYRVSAKSWIELGDTPLVRGEARLLLDRIEEFESLRRRSMSLQSPSAPGSVLTEALPQRTAESGSEASGWLVSVHTSLPGQPEFALTDDSANVLAYLRPTTGLNLRRYVQQPVTVYGMPGYLPNLAAKQIVVEKVVRLR